MSGGLPLQPGRQSAGERLLAFLRDRWFLTSLLVLIPVGYAVGQRKPPGVDGPDLSDYAAWVVAGVLFLMALTLDSRKLRASLARPTAVVWACVVGLIGLPLITWPVCRLQLTDDYRLGLVAVAAAPCTMAAASVWTRRAGGNDAVSLLTTLLTNGLCFVFTPALVAWLAGEAVSVDAAAMAWRLIKTALVPATAGQLTRLLLLRMADLDRLKTSLGVIAQAGILVIVFGASLKAGQQMTTAAGLGSGVAVAVMVASCLAIHLTAAAAAWWGGLAIGLSPADAAATLFAGSQKTLPIAMLVVTDPQMLGSAGAALAPVPVLTYHALQLFADTLIADRLRRGS